MKTITLSASLIFLALALIASVYVSNTRVATGSVGYGSEYKSSVLTASNTGTSSLKTISGTFGSVVLTDTSGAAGYIRVYDATATSGATTTLPLVVEVDAAASEGTYTFDVGVGNGVLIDVPSNFDGTMTVTYR